MTASTEPQASSDLAPADAMALTEQIRRTSGQLCHLLHRAYETRAHHALGYARWEDYVETELTMTRQNSYLLLEQARVIDAIGGALTGMAMTSALDTPAEPIALPAISARAARDIGGRLPEVITAVQERAATADPGDYAEIVREVVAEVRKTPAPPSALPVPPQQQKPPPLAPVPTDSTPAIVPDGISSPRDQAVLGALYELPVTIRRLPEGLLFEITNPGHPLQGWCGLARGATGLAAVMHDMLQEAKQCETDLRAGKFYAPLGEVISGKPRESTYDPADYTPLPDGRWLTPSGRKYGPDSWVMRQVLAKRAILGLPTVYSHGDDTDNAA